MKQWLLAVAVLLLALTLQTQALAGCSIRGCEATVEKILACMDKDYTKDFKQCRQFYEVQVREYCDCQRGQEEGKEVLSGTLLNNTTPNGWDVDICRYCTQSSVSQPCKDITDLCFAEDRPAQPTPSPQ